MGARNFYRFVIAVGGPPERSAVRQRVGLAGSREYGAVGPFVHITRQPMQSLAPAVESLDVQDGVHFRSPRQFGRPDLCPGVAKGFRGLTTAEETWAVSRGQPYR